jgi:hypothetical protein
MKFSMPSFFIGVGTVVGAIALGFGGGVLLTGSVIKETPVAPSRVERLAQPDRAAAPKIVAKADTPKIDASLAADAANPAPAQESAQPAVPLEAQASTIAVSPQGANAAAPVEQVVAKDSEQLSARDVERQRRAERQLAHKKSYAERRARSQAVAKMRQQQFEVREQAKPELAFEREDIGFNFFGRSDQPPADRE